MFYNQQYGGDNERSERCCQPSGSKQEACGSAYISGTEMYSTLSNLLAPTKHKETPFTDIVWTLEKHYNPKPLEIAEFSFWHPKSKV